MTAPLGVPAFAPFDRFVADVRAAFPGVLLSIIVALSAFALRAIPGVGFLSPMILAVIVGAAMRNSGAVPPAAQAGLRFALRRILRIAIILLGLQLTLGQVAAVGASGVAIIAVTLVSTFAFTIVGGRILKVDRRLSALIAAGTSICGASAVIAANTVTRAPDEDAAYAVACVTVFGSLSMVIYPLLLPFLPFGEHSYGLWTGASIHEIAQVVAAAFQGGADAGHFGTVAKLSRVMLLAPLVLAMGWFMARTRGNDECADSRAVPVPWFVFGFVALVGVNSIVVIDPDLKRLLIQVTTFLLTIALAAMGLETDASKLRARGLRPLLLGSAAWIFISVLSFLLIAMAF
jgi:uncharacterized integral membrane protein (TIGR00698 family)